MIRFVTPGAIRETYVLIILNSTITPHMLTVTIQLSFIAYVQRLNSMDITSFSVSNPLFLSSLITALSFFFFFSSPSLQVDSYLGNMEEKG